MNMKKQSLVSLIIFCSLAVACVLIILLGSAPVQAAVPAAPSTTPARPAATIVVTSSANSGAGTLRNAIAAAASSDTITFNGDMTITLASELVINKNLSIDGTGHNVTVSGNHTTRVFNVTAGNVTFAHLTIANGNVQTNDCGSISGQCGSGIMIQNSGVTVTVTNSTFANNSVANAGAGGGLFNYSGTLNVTNSTFSGNAADGRWGGGIYNYYGIVNVTNSTFSSNSAYQGGGLANQSGTLNVSNSTFSGNSGTGLGGGIFNYSGTLNVSNSTFSGNSAHPGGGIENQATLNYSNTIIANSMSGGDCVNSGTININANNLVQDGSCSTNGVNFKTGNPLLSTLGNYGGSTETLPLLPGSPAIDGGDNTTCAGLPGGNKDQRGKNRVGTCDIGAFESQGFTFGNLSGTPQNATINTAFTNPLAISITSAYAEPVNGGVMTFVGPLSGASTNPMTNTAMITNSVASKMVTANGIGGSYSVLASASGVTGNVSFTLTNLKADTTIGVTSAPNPSTYGQAVTFTATVTSANGTPSGTVQLYDNGVAFGAPFNLAGGQAVTSTTALTAGMHPITATYSGDANYAGSTSAMWVLGVHARSAVSTGDSHNCGLQVNGTLLCWGNNSTGQTTVPSPNVNWVQVSAGRLHTCGLKADGTLRCWGWNGEGETTVPSPNANWVQVSAGGLHTCGLKADGTLYCWGSNTNGETTVPSPNANWVQASAGSLHTCGLKADGTLYCWGFNTYRQTTVPSPNANWVQASAGGNHTCGLKADGTLYCWGDSIYGQTTVPSQNTNWVQASAGGNHTCGLKADGTVYCWGWNYYGQTTVPSPNANWAQVSAGLYHTCGLKADGTLRCWGRNDFGQAPSITLTPGTLPTATVGVTYTQSITAAVTTGATPPYLTTVIAGTVPTGLTLNTDGTWSGVPTVAGTFNFTAQARDANNIASTRDYTLTVDKASTTTSVTSMPNPSTYGQAVTFTAIVTSSVGTPMGSVQFYIAGVAFGSPVALSGGIAATNTSVLVVDSHPITATYSGDLNYAVSTSTTYTHLVNKASTTVTVTSSSTPSTYGQAVTFTATVTSASGTPTGNITFTIDMKNIGSVALTSGVATYVTNTLIVGTHPVTATYSGDTTYNPSSGTLSGGQTVTDVAITGLTAHNSSPTRLTDVTTFTATISNGSNVTYHWNFGDGQTASGATMNHTYAAAGSYTALVTATNSVGSISASTLVTITNQAPLANAGPDQNVLVNATVALNGSTSTDPDGHLPLTYSWTQTGGPAMTFIPNLSVTTFTAPSAPTVLTFTLNVTDAQGLRNTTGDSVVITVGDVVITGLSASNSSPTRLTDATYFTATLNTSSNVTYQWNFGDGQTGSGATTNHIYAVMGNYTAIVTATNGAGSVSASTLVTITNQVPLANAGSDQTVRVKTLVMLNGSGSTDSDGHLPLAYGWAQTGGPTATFTPHLSVTTFTAPSVATVLTFTLVVTDTQGAVSVPDQVVITVKPFNLYLPLILKQ